MKKSSGLYWGMHVIILLIPIVFLLALRFKIASGDIVDVIAQRAAGVKVHKLPVLHGIEINSNSRGTGSHLEVSLVVSDSLQEMEMDTSTAKYISFQLVGDKLVLNYDFQKDSLDQVKSKQQQHGESDLDVESYMVHANDGRRMVSVHVQSYMSSISAQRANVTLQWINDEQKISDLDVTCRQSSFTLEAPEIWEEDEDHNSKRVLYRFEHRLGLHLLEGSDARLNYIGYIRNYDLEIKGESKMEDYFRTGTFNLAIDKQSSFMMDVNDLDQVKIKYE